MAKCPECGAEISCLNAPAVIKQMHVLTADGETLHEEGIDPEFPEISGYECPECDAQLFTDEDEAIKFLRAADNETT